MALLDPKVPLLVPSKTSENGHRVNLEENHARLTQAVGGVYPRRPSTAASS